jgi:hypothetical protein
MANKIIIIIVVALIVMLVLSLTAKQEKYDEPESFPSNTRVRMVCDNTHHCLPCTLKSNGFYDCSHARGGL